MLAWCVERFKLAVGRQSGRSALVRRRHLRGHWRPCRQPHVPRRRSGRRIPRRSQPRYFNVLIVFCTAHRSRDTSFCRLIATAGAVMSALCAGLASLHVDLLRHGRTDVERSLGLRGSDRRPQPSRLRHRRRPWRHRRLG